MAHTKLARWTEANEPAKATSVIFALDAYRRSFATAELPEEKAEAIGQSRMDARHAHLDALLDPK